MTNWVRTGLFTLAFYGVSVLIVATVPISALFGRRAVIRHAVFWSRQQRWTARWLLGISIRTEGTPSPTPVLYAAKHQAMFETLELQVQLGGPAMVLKQELTRIPVWGWAARRYGALIVDREGSATALRAMMREANEAKRDGRSILIFPEGTRVLPGEHPPLKAGFAGLYRMLGMPVVPIALDSGHTMRRHGAKRPGVVNIRYGEPIPPGLPRAEVEARVHAAINALDGTGSGA